MAFEVIGPVIVLETLRYHHFRFSRDYEENRMRRQFGSGGGICLWVDDEYCRGESFCLYDNILDLALRLALFERVLECDSRVSDVSYQSKVIPVAGYKAKKAEMLASGHLMSKPRIRTACACGA